MELLHAAGGVALLIFGIRFLRQGLDRLFGDRLQTFLGRLSGNPINGVLFGAGLTLLVPSSTTMSLLSISMVQAGKMTFRQAMAVMLGAQIGITVTVQLVSLNMHHHAPVLVLIGVIVMQLVRRTRFRGSGQAILALGLIFMGVAIVADSTSGLARSDDLLEVLSIAARYPVLLTLVAAVLCVIFQSSTTTMTLVLSLAYADVLMLDVALPMMYGANIGIALTAMMAGWSQPDSRRLGVGVFVCKFSIAIALLLLGQLVVRWVELSPGGLARQLANAHTGFNLLVAIIWLPFLPVVARVLERAIPKRAAIEDDFSPMYLDPRWANEPHIAFTQTKREIGRMGQHVLTMLRDFWTAMKNEDTDLVRRIRRRDDYVDRLDKSIKYYLTQQMAEGLNPAEAKSRMAQLRFMSDLETIGDVIDRNLLNAAEKKIRKGVRFSNQGFTELREMFDEVLSHLQLAIAAFMENDPRLAERLLAHKEVVRDKELALREQHFRRLQQGQREAFETTELHLEVLTQLKHISHIASAVAYSVLEAADRRDQPISLSLDDSVI